MKRRTFKKIRCSACALTAILAGVMIATAVTANAETDTQLEQVDEFIATHENTSNTLNALEPETVSLSYTEWQAQQEPDIYSMDVWTLGSYLYGIPEYDTTRSLILISYENYGDSVLSYYVGCACWARATNDYFGLDNLFTAFGGMDPQYDLWMDELGWDDYAVDVLRDCYLHPMYITGCNGVDTPESWIYAEDTECGTIYVW